MDPFRQLPETRRPVADIPVDPAPGVYALFARSPDCLPNITVPTSGLLYIGLATQLARRNHFKAGHSGFSSPRRSLGAILKTELSLTAIPRSAGASATNYRNFRFTPDGEDRLRDWMWQNLDYAILPFDDDIDRLETELIRAAEPPLNLTKWANPQKKRIQALRTICKAEARANRHLVV